MLDMHFHVIPNVDDGAENIEESLRLLEMQKEDGVDAVIATPHFYPQMADISEYFEKVDQQLELLKKHCGSNLPHIFKGFEVRYFNGISTTTEIDKMVLGGSNYILVELPYESEITNYMLDEIANIYDNVGIVPILAHVERYYKYNNFSKVVKLLNKGEVLAHVNASSICSRLYGKQTLDLIKKGIITFVASDAHSVNGRPPLLKSAYKVISDKLGEEYKNEFIKNSDKLLNIIKKVEEK